MTSDQRDPIGPVYARLRSASRHARGLLTAIVASPHADPLDDAAVAAILDDIRHDGSAGRVCRWFAASATSVLARVNLDRFSHEEACLTVERLREVLREELDPALVDDCVAVMEGMSNPVGRPIELDAQVRRTVETWGPYALAVMAIVLWRLIVTLAEDVLDRSPTEVLREWMLEEEGAFWRMDRRGEARRKDRDDPR